MKRSRLKNKANKTKKPIDISNFKKQRNKPFWVNCNPYFSNKYSKADTDIVLNENGDLILKKRRSCKDF